MPNLPPEQRAQAYADAVQAGTIVVGKLVKAAIARHVKDCERANTDPSYPYAFDEQRGARVAKFIEFLPHTKGRWAAQRQRLTLEPWQCFLVVVLFGWYNKKTSRRRFREAYLEVPRKNGKSILDAGIGLYMLLADKEFGAEVYCGATTEKQAWEVFRPAKQMMERTPRLVHTFGAEIAAKTLFVPRLGSKFEPVIGTPGDGPSPSCAIVDEYHEHDTPSQHDSMETGMGAREQPLLLITTTAGYNNASPCYEKHDEVARVIQGLAENDNLFGIIYGIDDEDDWADPNILQKANPNYNVSVDAEFLLAQQRQAMANPVQQNKFKTKHLNVWCSVHAAWMNPQWWALATDKMLEEDELLQTGDAQCWIAADHAMKTDLFTEQRLYRRMLHGEAHYYLFGRYWLPEDTIDEEGPNHAHYLKWVRMGLLTPTEGATIDFDQVITQITADVKRVNPLEVVYDPFIATQMAQKLEGAGVKRLVEFLQLPHNFAVPMDEFIATLKDGRFHHDGNEITAWCMTNVVARPTKKGLFAPMKSKPHLKIDGAVAAVMAFARAIAAKEKAAAYQFISL